MGHVKPMVALLRALVQADQQIVCYGHSKFESHIAAPGVSFRAYPHIDYDVDRPDFNLVKMAADLMEAARVIYKKLMPEVAALGPDLILQDFMAPWASRIGTDLATPRIHTIPTLVFNRETQHAMRKEEGLLKLTIDVARGAGPLLRALIRTKFANSVGEVFGLDGAWGRLAPPLCELVFSLEAVQPGQTAGAIPRHYIGPASPGTNRNPSAEANGRALITFGTLSNNNTLRFEAAIRGAFRAGYSVVAVAGSKVDRHHLASVGSSLCTENPGRTINVLETVPNLESLIADSAVVIHHAGMATTWEVVRSRKPALFIPTIADQKVLSTQLERLGVGLRITPGGEDDPVAIGEALAELRRRQISWVHVEEMLTRAGGAAAGAKIILNAMGGQR